MSQNRKQVLLIGAVLTSLILATLWSGISGAGKVDSLARTSTFISDKSGSKATYLVLEHFLPNLARVRKPLRFWVQEEKTGGTTLVIQKPHLEIEVRDAQALVTWVYQGGRLIFVSGSPWTIQAQKETGFPKEEETTGEFSEDLDQAPPPEQQQDHSQDETEATRTPFQVSVGENLIKRFGFIINNENADGPQTFGPLKLKSVRLEGAQVEPLISHDNKTIVGKVSYGKGEVIVVADGRAFSNERLAESGNVYWLLQQCLQRGGPVFFDEFHHGFGAGRTCLP